MQMRELSRSSKGEWRKMPRRQVVFRSGDGGVLGKLEIPQPCQAGLTRSGRRRRRLKVHGDLSDDSFQVPLGFELDLHLVPFQGRDAHIDLGWRIVPSEVLEGFQGVGEVSGPHEGDSAIEETHKAVVGNVHHRPPICER